MLKKILIGLGALAALIVILVIIAGVVIYVKMDKEFISAQMAKALNRQVYIEKIDVSIFSVLSGLEIKNMAISNFKTPQELALVQGKPVAANDLFAGMESLRFKIKFLPLLKRQIELKELVIYSPVINLAKNKQGILNIDDLIKTKKPVPEKETKEMKAPEPAPPISADSLPLAIAVGEIGMKNGAINYHDGKTDQRFQVYQLTTLAHDINIDPSDLEHKDEVKLKLGMGIKTVGAMKSGSVQSFDVKIDAIGKVIPFDVKTRFLDPEILLRVNIPDGEITGLQIFNAIAAIPILGDYLGEHISFLKGKQEWKNSSESGLDLRYKADNAELKNGRLALKDAAINFDGATNIASQAIDMNLEMVLKKEVNDSVKNSLAKKMEGLIKNPEVKKYADYGTIAQTAMKPLLNKDGLIALQSKVGGLTNKPAVKLVSPQLGSLGNVAKESAGDIAKSAGKTAVKQLLKEDQQKTLEDIGGLLKKK